MGLRYRRPALCTGGCKVKIHVPRGLYWPCGGEGRTAGRGWVVSRGCRRGRRGWRSGRGRRAWRRWRCSRDGVPVAGDLLGAEPAGYLLLGLSGSQIAFCLVGGGWEPQVGGEAEHVVLPVAQAFKQVAAGLLFAAGDAGNLGQAEQDAMLERMDQGRGDLARDGGKALSAGGVRGVDAFLEGLADLDGPVRIRVGLGGAGQVAQDVLGAELAAQAGDGLVVLVPVVDDDGPA